MHTEHDLENWYICQVSPYFCINLAVHIFPHYVLAMDSFLHAKSTIHATFLSSSTSSNLVTTFFIFSINSSLSLSVSHSLCPSSNSSAHIVVTSLHAQFFHMYFTSAFDMSVKLSSLTPPHPKSATHRSKFSRHFTFPFQWQCLHCYPFHPALLLPSPCAKILHISS